MGAETDARAVADEAAATAGRRDRFLNGFVYVAFGLSGAAALIYEVVWSRKLAAVMGSSTYALSTMLAAFMLGLALGGLLGAVWVVKLKRPLRAFALCELAIGLSALATLPLIKVAAPLFLRVYFAFQSSFTAFALAQFAAVFLVLLVPTTLMGATFPLVIRHYADGRSATARRAGLLYACNTFGAVVGSLAAGFLLIPALGAGDALLTAALLNLGGALVILTLQEPGRRSYARIPILLLAAVTLRLLDPPFVPFISTYSAHRFGTWEAAAAVQAEITRAGADNVIVFQHEGVESDVTLMRERGNDNWILVNNGKLEGGADSDGFVLLAYLPAFSHATDPDGLRALNIGLGSAVTLGHLAALPFRRIDSIEISEGILEANRRFVSPELFTDPRIEHTLADGRNHLRLHPDEAWDVIVVSPSWAVERASAGLLTDEFFALAAQRLAPGGLLAVWLDRFYVPDEDIAVVLRTFRRSFPNATAWSIGGVELVLIGSLRPFAHTAAEVAERVAAHRPELAGRFEVAHTSESIAELPDGPIHTDDHPILEFRNARHLLTGPAAAN